MSYDLLVQPPEGSPGVEQSVLLGHLRSMPGLVEHGETFLLGEVFVYAVRASDDGATESDQMTGVHIAVSLGDVPSVGAFAFAQALAARVAWQVFDVQIDCIVGAGEGERVQESQRAWARMAGATVASVAARAAGKDGLEGMTLIDGWYVKDPSEYRLVVDHAPPRPFGYLDQLKEELTSPIAFLTYLASTIAIAAGVWRGLWWLAVLGAGAFYLFASMYPTLVKVHRDGRLITVRTRDLRNIIAHRGLVTVDRSVSEHPLGVDAVPYRYLENQHGAVEVLLLKHESIRDLFVVGMRGAEGGAGPGPTAEPGSPLPG